MNPFRQRGSKEIRVTRICQVQRLIGLLFTTAYPVPHTRFTN